MSHETLNGLSSEAWNSMNNPMSRDAEWLVDLELEDDTDRLIRLALLAEAGLSLAELRAYEGQSAREAS